MADRLDVILEQINQLKGESPFDDAVQDTLLLVHEELKYLRDEVESKVKR